MNNSHFLLIITIFLCSCTKEIQTDIGKVYKTDNNCINEIEKAKNDFREKKKVYFIINGFGSSFESNEEIKKSLKSEGINSTEILSSCLFDERNLENCYAREMNFLYSKEIGKERLNKLIEAGKYNYITKHNFKVFNNSDDSFIVNLDRNNLSISYPKKYKFSSSDKDYAYYKIYFKVTESKIEKMEIDLNLNDKSSTEYYQNQIFDNALKLQVENFIKNEVKRFKLNDNQYSVIIMIQ